MLSWSLISPKADLRADQHAGQQVGEQQRLPQPVARRTPAPAAIEMHKPMLDNRSRCSPTTTLRMRTGYVLSR